MPSLKKGHQSFMVFKGRKGIEDVDFWESLAARMSRGLDYETLCEKFSWNLPPHYNIGVDVCDRHAGDKGKLALVFDREDGTAEKWTFWELKRSSDRFANALRGLGIERGDRVAVLLSQSPQLPIAHIAAYKLGAIVVPLFALFGEDALRFRLEDSGAKVIVTDVEHFETVSALREELSDLGHIILTDGERAGAVTFDGLIREASSGFKPVVTQSEDPAIIIYTSGTTGSPKGACTGTGCCSGICRASAFRTTLCPEGGICSGRQRTGPGSGASSTSSSQRCTGVSPWSPTGC